MSEAQRLRAAVVGATGYGGAELIRILSRHPRIELVRAVAVDRVGEPVGAVHPAFDGLCDLVVEEMPIEQAVSDVDVAFFALPHRVTARAMAPVLDRDVRIVDMSGDFRLRDPEAYAAYYGQTHPCPNELGRFVYGLPELHRERLRGARRIASPGCFATCISLALLPLARQGWLDRPVRVVAATGSSGSGVRPSTGTHHPVRAVNLKTYKPLRHQHTPEIEQTLRDAGAGPGFRLDFVPVSAPLSRGILATCIAEFERPVDRDTLVNLYRSAYADAPFVRVPAGRMPEVAAVKGSMYAEVGVEVGSRGESAAVAVAAIDNLVKGGAGQAVQSFNVSMGWPETLGLDAPPLWP